MNENRAGKVILLRKALPAHLLGNHSLHYVGGKSISPQRVAKDFIAYSIGTPLHRIPFSLSLLH